MISGTPYEARRAKRNSKQREEDDFNGKVSLSRDESREIPNDAEQSGTNCMGTRGK